MANIKINDIESSNSDLLCEPSQKEMIFIEGGYSSFLYKNFLILQGPISPMLKDILNSGNPHPNLTGLFHSEKFQNML